MHRYTLTGEGPPTTIEVGTYRWEGYSCRTMPDGGEAPEFPDGEMVAIMPLKVFNHDVLARSNGNGSGPDVTLRRWDGHAEKPYSSRGLSVPDGESIAVISEKDFDALKEWLEEDRMTKGRNGRSYGGNGISGG